MAMSRASDKPSSKIRDSAISSPATNKPWSTPPRLSQKQASACAPWSAHLPSDPALQTWLTGAATATINRLPVLLAPRRYFCPPQCSPRAAAARIRGHARHLRKRLLQTSLAILGSHPAPRAIAHLAARSHARADLSGGHRRGHHRLSARCAGRSIRFPRRVFQEDDLGNPSKSLRPKSAETRRRMAARRKKTADRSRGRCPLLASLRAASEIRRSHRNSNLRNASRQRLATRTIIRNNSARLGVTGTPGANIVARAADLILGIGTRYSDFTTASKTAFQNPTVRFININVAEFDAYKHAALPLIGDARTTIAELQSASQGFRRRSKLQQRNSRSSAPVGKQKWIAFTRHATPPSSPRAK